MSGLRNILSLGGLDDDHALPVGYMLDGDHLAKNLWPAVLRRASIFVVRANTALAFNMPPSGDLLPPSPPAEKATARCDPAGKASTGDGAGNAGGYRRRA
jgi:hypothetical protein